MNKYLSFYKAIVLFVLLLFMIFLQKFTMNPWAEELPVSAYHPKDGLDTKPKCTACHDGITDTVMGKPIQSFNHGENWYTTHKFKGSYAINLCRTCHAVSFCTDCHTFNDELKPSLKHAGKPRRWFPHRGSYLFQHRIDGNIDPARCYQCHGKRNNAKCIRCHRNGK